MKTLHQAFKPEHNSLGWMRFVLSLCVVLSHAFVLGFATSKPLELFSGGQTDIGVLAVDGFFLLSGFLVARSYLNLASPARYAWHRFLRIFPGYWTCVLVCGLVLAPAIYFSRYGAAGLWEKTGASIVDFVWRGFQFTAETAWIMPTFEGLPFGGPLNGSVWSLPYEVKCYVFLGCLGYLGALKNRGWLLATAVVFWMLWISPDGFGIASERTSRLGAYFLCGAAFYLFRKQIPFHAGLAAASVWLLILGLRTKMAFVGPAPLCYLLLFVSIKAPFTRFTEKSDLSYGLFLYSFPIQQFLSAMGVPAWGKTLYFIASVALTLPLAWLSWNVIENPALGWKGWTPKSKVAQKRKTAPARRKAS